jgi:hypothetical protein
MQVGGASSSSGGAASPIELAAAVEQASRPAVSIPLYTPDGLLDGSGGDQVGAAVKTRPRPVLPTPAEVTEHEATHHPYRNWCRHCVAGAGRRDGHAAVSHDSRDEGIVTLSADYCYFNDEALVGQPAGKHTPILITKVRGGAIFSDMVLEKGQHWHSVARLVDHCVWLGEPRLKFRSDGEPAVAALLAKVAVELKGRGVAVVPDLTPKGDSQAGGEQESAVTVFKNKARTMWHQACELHGVADRPDHALLPWLVQYAGQLVTRTHLHPDGRSSWSKVTGRREFPRAFLPWGEKVHFVAGGGKFKAGLAAKWDEGIFCALVESSNEYIIATMSGVVKSSNVKRMAKEHARDPVLFNSVCGVPWKLTPSTLAGVRQEVGIQIKMDIKPVCGTLPEPLGLGAAAEPKRVYIRKDVELVKYGFTDGCRGCAAAALGERAVGHDETCRLRIERRILEEEEPAIRARLEAAKRRRIGEPAAETGGAEPGISPANVPVPGAGAVDRDLLDGPVASPAVEGMDIDGFFSQFSLELCEDSKEFLALAENTGGGSELAGLLFDLRGECDLSNPGHYDMACKYQAELKPLLLVCSADCAPFKLLRESRAGSKEAEHLRRQGVLHLRRTRELCDRQLEAGRLFVCLMPDLKGGHGLTLHADLCLCAGVLEVVLPKCEDGRQGRATTNSALIKGELESGRRSVDDSLLHGLSASLRVAGRLMSVEAGGPTIEEAPPTDEWAPKFYDEITGALLDPRLVAEGRASEIGFMHKLKVYEEASMEEVLGLGLTPIPMRWIDINKGDDENPYVRCRAVLQETRKRSDLGPNDIASTFAGTPPLEGLRAMVSCAQTGQQEVPQRLKRVLGFYDVSRAHFHSPAKRRMYVRTLPEDTTIKSGVARLLKAMYGSRDAGNCWDDFAGQVMSKLGFAEGVISPCIYFSKEWNAPCWRHGDDFVLLATRAQHVEFMTRANKEMIFKCEGILGPCKDLGDVPEVRCLNRILRFVQPAFSKAELGYVEWEADPRHLEILTSQVGLKADSKPLGQPSIKMEKDADERPLSVEGRTLYRSATMRLSYVAQDRCDIQYACKELARHMQEPTEWDLSQLKRAVRYMIGSGRVVQRFDQQSVPDRLTVCTDSDFAGCVRTRKSTSCCMVFLGSHLLRSTSTTQAIISLSSGEAELLGGQGREYCVGHGWPDAGSRRRGC